MKRTIITLFVLLGFFSSTCCLAQRQNLVLPSENEDGEVYHVNYWVTGGIALTGAVTNTIGLRRLRDKPDIAADHIDKIIAKGVGRFDEWALKQNPDKRDDAASTSDLILLSSVAMPVVLFLDKEIRQDWLDIVAMYGATQAIASNMYSWGPFGPAFIDRYRPALYYTELPLEERNFGNLRNSFFSGHVNSTATGLFFSAKVFTDYHPELGAKKFLFYGLATVPTATVAVLRIKALKHFPSDVIVGSLVGASMGILIPELHRRWQHRLNVAAIYSNEVKGLGIHYHF